MTDLSEEDLIPDFRNKLEILKAARTIVRAGLHFDLYQMHDYMEEFIRALIPGERPKRRNAGWDLVTESRGYKVEIKCSTECFEHKTDLKKVPGFQFSKLKGADNESKLEVDAYVLIGYKPAQDEFWCFVVDPFYVRSTCGKIEIPAWRSRGQNLDNKHWVYLIPLEMVRATVNFCGQYHRSYSDCPKDLQEQGRKEYLSRLATLRKLAEWELPTNLTWGPS
jgi:hypothetical protein